MTLPFDPRLVPTEALPELPPVPVERLLPHALRQHFARPPAWAAEPSTERSSLLADAVPAAVLIPLVSREAVLQTLFTQRSAHLRAHGGQISFPGGRAEAYDTDPVATALREAHEEIGLQAERVEVLGTLPVFVTGTGFAVTPVVGLIEAGPQEAQSLHLRPDPQEVDGVFEVPLAFLMDPANHRKHRVSIGEHSFSYFAMPWQPAADDVEHFIWGATAGMLRNLYRMLSA